MITGTLRGYDPFMNLVIDEATEHTKNGAVLNQIGMVVVRGNSVVMIEALEKLM
jgi:small nuclear ribonucleoprotein G